MNDQDDGDKKSQENSVAVSQSLNQPLSKPLVFGFIEDLKYGQHKNPVKYFLQNHNNE